MCEVARILSLQGDQIRKNTPNNNYKSIRNVFDRNAMADDPITQLRKVLKFVSLRSKTVWCIFVNVEFSEGGELQQFWPASPGGYKAILTISPAQLSPLTWKFVMVKFRFHPSVCRYVIYIPSGPPPGESPGITHVGVSTLNHTS